MILSKSPMFCLLIAVLACAGLRASTEKRPARVDVESLSRSPATATASAPAKHRRSARDSSNRVTEIVLTVAERALAVLPRFAPVDGRQRD